MTIPRRNYDLLGKFGHLVLIFHTPMVVNCMEMYSASFYVYFTSNECTGFGWNFRNSTDEKNKHLFTHEDYDIVSSTIKSLWSNSSS